MNKYKLARFEETFAILIQADEKNNEISILKERLIAFAKPGDFLLIDFDSMGNLKHVEILPPLDKMENV